MKAYTETNFYFGVILAAFGLGIWKFDWVFICIPFLLFIQHSIIQWNQYHQFLAEVYLKELEKKIQKRISIQDQKLGLSFYRFYDILFKQGFIIRSKITKIPLIKPTGLLSISIAALNILLLSYSLGRTKIIFDQYFLGPPLQLTYFITVAIIFLLISYNFLSMKTRIKRTLSEIIVEMNNSTLEKIINRNNKKR
jgi:hypothetical protein